MYEDYLQRALSDIVQARQALSEYNGSNVSKTMKNKAAYNVQQALEHMIKYLIYNHKEYNKGSIDIRQLFTHDLDKLIKSYCEPYKIKVPGVVVKNADMYSKWEAESRYTLGFSARKNSISVAIREAEDWLVAIKPEYKKHIIRYREKYRYG